MMATSTAGARWRRAVTTAGVVLAGVGVLGGCAHRAAAPTASTLPSSSAPTSSTSTARPGSRPLGGAGADDGMATVAPGRAGTPRGGAVAHGGVRRGSASSVARAAVLITTRMDTTIDRAPVDAEARAAWLMTGRLARAVRTPVTGTGGGLWDAATAHRAWSTPVLASTSLGTDTPSTPTLTGRCYLVTISWHGTHGWHRTQRDVGYCVELTRTPHTSAWQVAQLTVNPDLAAGS